MSLPFSDPSVIAAAVTGAAAVIAAWIAVGVKRRAASDAEMPPSSEEQLKGWNTLTGHLYKEIADQRREIADLKIEMVRREAEWVRRESDCDRRIAALETTVAKLRMPSP